MQNDQPTRPELIAEIGQAHDGSLGMAHAFIDALAESGADTVKFQVHIAEAESSLQEPFRTPFSFEDSTRFDYWKRMEFRREQWQELLKHCEEAGVGFLASPFSMEAVELLESIGAPRYKIGSGEVTNALLIDRIAETGKPVLLSSGMSTFEELDTAVQRFRQKNVPVSVFQCTTAYPTPADQVGLNVIPQLLQRYDCPVGLSDHSGQVYAMLAATALGASMLEFHVVWDRRQFGPDSSSSLDMNGVRMLRAGSEFISRSLAHPVDKSDASAFADVKQIFEKSLAVNRDMKAGESIGRHVLESKKPAGMGIPASQYERIQGRILARPLKKWEFLNPTDLVDLAESEDADA